MTITSFNTAGIFRSLEELDEMGYEPSSAQDEIMIAIALENEIPLSVNTEYNRIISEAEIYLADVTQYSK